MSAVLTPVRTVGVWELGQHSSGGWRQWYVRNVRSQTVGLVDYGDAADAELPGDLHLFSAADVDRMRSIVWKWTLP